MEDIGGSVHAATGGDDIEVGSIGGDLNIQTGGGRVSIGSVKGPSTPAPAAETSCWSQATWGLSAGRGRNIQVKQCGES